MGSPVSHSCHLWQQWANPYPCGFVPSRCPHSRKASWMLASRLAHMPSNWHIGQAASRAVGKSPMSRAYRTGLTRILGACPARSYARKIRRAARWTRFNDRSTSAPEPPCQAMYAGALDGGAFVPACPPAPLASECAIGVPPDGRDGSRTAASCWAARIQQERRRRSKPDPPRRAFLHADLGL